MVTRVVARSVPPIDHSDRFEKAAAAAKERPRWKTSYKGPDRDRQKIDGKAIVSREELEDFKRKHGQHLTLRDLLNADKTGKLPTPVATGSGRGKAEGRRAEDDVVYKPTPQMERELADMMSRPGRDAIEPTLGPELGVAGLGRLAVKEGVGALMRGLGGAFGRRAASKAADDLVEPVGDLAPQGSVFRSARPDAEAAKQAEYMRRVEELGLKKGGSTKSYAKGGSVRGGGCETRTKKTRYI